ncbi:rhomboid family intramembrane serine protease [Clostridium sp. MD294]|uniref:rhomboid family intramembrane serine protease n=1 Tax=Clostridium sp. MD294 TaxID=97138 RepID=UPI0002CC2FDD|nr:rhomboid family intramembrane serine protease [Clostridium sp. MD294]USF29410.1 Rhomboid protease GlpG [Clostridium sp. MD294]
MYYTILQNFVKKLIENEFELYTAFHITETQQHNRVILFKQQSPILYIISIINGEKIELQNHEIFMNKYLQQLQNSLTLYHCSKIIALTVVIGEFSQQTSQKNSTDISQVIHFVNQKELLAEEKYFHAWWYVSCAKKTIEMHKSQPQNILHIKQMILDCLENKYQNQSHTSLSEIAIEVKQKNIVSLKSNNILLTFHLLCINSFIFLGMILLGLKQSAILSLGVEHYAVFNIKQYYRIITYCFIHTNILHLIQNSVYLYYFGMHTELLYGKIKMAIIYFFSAIGSGILSALCNDAVSVGASGAIFGLMGAVFVYSYYHGKKSIGMNYMTLLLLVVIALLSGLLQQNVDYFGHFGGFIMGSLVSFIILKYY